MSTTTTATFGDLLRRHRLALGLTQEQLAERTQVSLRAISDLERGARNRPYRETVIRLANALGVSEPARGELFAAARRVVSSSKGDARSDASEPIRFVRDVRVSSGREIRHNLPVPLSSFVGRERELTEIRRLLVGPASTGRLLTLTGPPGTVKTRLAIEVRLALVDDFPDGIVFVPLAAIADPQLVLPAIASGCRFEGFGGQDLIERVSQALRGKRILLDLDNFEQVTAAPPLLAQLLEYGPTVKALVTSRSRLHVRGERELALTPLPVPGSSARTGDGEPAALARQFASVQLFVERVREARSEFALTPDNSPAVAEICRRLDGLPLAIELAARRGKILSPETILAHLRDRFQFLSSGPADGPVHQQTLYQAIAWSYDLLTPDEQQLFRQLAVFVGGFTLPSASLLIADDQEVNSLLADSAGAPTRQESDNDRAESTGARAVLPRGGSDDGKAWGWGTPEPRFPADRRIVWSADWNSLGITPPEAVLRGVETLVDRSLVDPVEGGERFRMLESIRAFGLERLAASGELETLRRRHAAYFRALAETPAVHFRGRTEGEWIDSLEREQDNLRAALQFMIHNGDVQHALRLGGLSQWLWIVRSHVAWGVRIWLEELLAVVSRSEHAFDRARVLRAAGRAAFWQSDHAVALDRTAESLEISRAIGDRDGIAESVAILGLVARAQGDYDRARALSEESLAIWRDLGNDGAIGAQLDRIGMLAFYQGDPVTACALLEESLEIRRELGDGIFLGWALHELGRVHRGLGQTTVAHSLFDESLVVWQEQGYREGIPFAFASLGDLAIDRGDPAAAFSLLAESLTSFRNNGQRGAVAIVLDLLAGLAAAENRSERALRLAAASAEGQAMTLEQAVDYALEDGGG